MTPSFLLSTLRIFELSLAEMLWARRTIYVALLLTGPILLALLSRIVASGDAAVLTVNGQRLGSTALFGTVVWVLFLKFIVPALGVLYGTSLIADEVEDKTITYLFVRPIPRQSIVAGKFLAYLVCTVSVVLPSLTVAYLFMVPFSDMAGTFVPLVQDLGILVVGLAVYGAIFLLAGAALKRPLVTGLVFAFGWEQIAQVLPGYLRYLTVAYHLRALVPQPTTDDNLTLVPSALGSSSVAANLFWLALVTVMAVILAMRTVERREYVLEQ